MKNRSRQEWRDFVFDLAMAFEEKAIEIYRYQWSWQPHYRKFCEGLGCRQSSETMPLMPIKVYRDRSVQASGTCRPEAVFQSSGTTGVVKSRHEIADLALYRASCYRGYASFYDPSKYILLAYLPGYQDNPNSSLITMISHVIEMDTTDESCFLPLAGQRHPTDDQRKVSVVDVLKEIQNVQIKAISQGRKIMLFGAAFGLLDLLDDGSFFLAKDAIVVETGGMKTYRKEITKKALRKRLSDGFGISPTSIHSEYGMAEMCSQAWDMGDGWFQTPPWLNVTIRNPVNPMLEQAPGEEGLIGIMDLANVHSISFLLTEDKGIANEKGHFQVHGRWDFSTLRGCNFLME